MDNDFFPEDYSVPKSGNEFLKFEKGETVFRVLDRVTMGYEYWTKEKKPVRSLNEFKDFPSRTDAATDKDGNVINPKHIWVMPVWNVNEKAVQILQVPQKTVQETIVSFGRDKDWGDPRQYDIRVVREGDGFDTKYTVTPKPQKELDSAIAEAYAKVKDKVEKTISDMFAE